MEGNSKSTVKDELSIFLPENEEEMYSCEDLTGIIGRELCRRRENIGLTQQDITDKSGIKRGYLSCIEKGKRDFSTSNLVKYLKATNSSLDDIIYPESDVSEEERSVNDAIKYMLKHLPLEDKRKILEISKILYPDCFPMEYAEKRKVLKEEREKNQKEN